MAFSLSFSLLTVLLAALPSTTVAQERGGGTVGFDHLAKRQTFVCNNRAWVPICPMPLPCAPPGAICCEPQKYAIPPATCPAGTTPVGNTVPSGSSSVVVSTITSAPTPPPVVDVTYTSYTLRLTYTYWWYYWTYYAAFAQSTIVSSTRYWSTTVYFTATDDAAASVISASYTSSLSQFIPKQTETPVVTGPAPTSFVPSETPTPETTTEVLPTVAPNNTFASPSSPPLFTGGASLVRAGSSFFGSFLLAGLGMLVVAPGALMVLL